MMSKQSEPYDFIIAGAGAAGLSLLYHLLQEEDFCNKKFLVIDREDKVNLDRTWCFWEKENGLFEDCVEKSWNKLRFASPTWEGILSPSPYRYKMIQSDKFYKFCWTKIKKHPNVEICYTNILGITPQIVNTEIGNFGGKYIFNSAIFNISPTNTSYFLKQHFKGWYISFEKELFNPEVATLMDFTIEQHDECRFMYILPTSSKKALVEFTIFSEKILDLKEYDISLGNYLQTKFPNEKYTIEHEEFGIIPMTNAPILSPSSDKDNIYAIGTAGQATKASSGYTFTFIQKQCRTIIKKLKNNSLTKKDLSPDWKFQLFDSILLNVLATHKVEAWQVFNQLFESLPTALVLKFLNEETHFLEDLKIMWHTDKAKFTQAALEELLSGAKKSPFK